VETEKEGMSKARMERLERALPNAHEDGDEERIVADVPRTGPGSKAASGGCTGRHRGFPKEFMI
jgi:hypothetical protein